MASALPSMLACPRCFEAIQTPRPSPRELGRTAAAPRDGTAWPPVASLSVLADAPSLRSFEYICGRRLALRERTLQT